MKFLFLVATLLLSTSCTAQEQPTTPTTVTTVVPAIVTPTTGTPGVLYRCAYKYESKYDIEFLESNRVEFRPPALPELLVYRITDTRGQRWSINEYDWKNYNCTTTTITQG